MKIALIVLGCMLALVVVFFFLRVRGVAEYSGQGVLVQLHIACFNFTIVPTSQKKKKRQNAKRTTKEKSLQAKNKEWSVLQDGGSFAQLQFLLHMGVATLENLCRSVRIEFLRVHYTVAGQENPAQAALLYGGVCVGGGALCAFLERYFDVRQREVSAEVDFNAESSKIYVAASCSIRIGQAIIIALKLCVQYLKWKKRQNQAVQEVKIDGEEKSSRRSDGNHNGEATRNR